MSDTTVKYWLRMPDDLHRFVKAEAALAGQTINDVVVEAVKGWKRLKTKGE